MKAIAFLLAILFSVNIASADIPEAKVTLVVLDQKGDPVEAAIAGVAFDTVDEVSLDTSIKPIRGETNSSGEFTAQYKTQPVFHYGASKPGFYETTGLKFKAEGKNENGWIPWNPKLPVILKKIINPVSMYAKRVSLVFPKPDEKFGFDLLKGDWVAPNGKGIVSDLFFLVRQDKEIRSFEVTFHKGDGLIPFKSKYHSGSVLKSDYLAPNEGYLSEWKESADQRTVDPNDDQCFYIRIRSLLDEKGEVKEALYGKIYGKFPKFVYYVNPDKSQNIEFDLKRNLFQKLGFMENPQYP